MTEELLDKALEVNRKNYETRGSIKRIENLREEYMKVVNCDNPQRIADLFSHAWNSQNSFYDRDVISRACVCAAKAFAESLTADLENKKKDVAKYEREFKNL